MVAGEIRYSFTITGYFDSLFWQQLIYQNIYWVMSITTEADVMFNNKVNQHNNFTIYLILT